jgi:hypothetical protein
MAKVEIKHAGEAPSATEEKKTIQVTDSRNRVLSLEEPNFLAEFRLIEAIGPELSANASWMMAYIPLTYIVDIDGHAVLPAQNKMQAEALIQRVGREGYNLVNDAIQKHFRVTKDDLDFAKN